MAERGECFGLAYLDLAGFNVWENVLSCGNVNVSNVGTGGEPPKQGGARTMSPTNQAATVTEWEAELQQATQGFLEAVEAQEVEVPAGEGREGIHVSALELIASRQFESQIQAKSQLKRSLGVALENYERASSAARELEQDLGQSIEKENTLKAEVIRLEALLRNSGGDTEALRKMLESLEQQVKKLSSKTKVQADEIKRMKEAAIHTEAKTKRRETALRQMLGQAFMWLDAAAKALGKLKGQEKSTGRIYKAIASMKKVIQKSGGA